MTPTHPQQHQNRPVASRFESRRFLVVLAAMLVALIVANNPQGAESYTVGRYNVEACTAAVGYANNSWKASTNNPAYLETHTSCGETPANYQSSTLTNLELGDVVNLTEEIPAGTEGTWKITVPKGETIAEVNGYSSLYRQGHSWHVYRETENTNGETNIETSCDQATTHACGLGGIFQATALKARTMIFRALCTPEEYEPGKYFTACPDGALVHDVRAGISYATVTINDPNPPEPPTASSVPSQPQHGTIDITTSATDIAAGILSLTVITKTGEIVGEHTFTSNCNYSQLTPCPTHLENQQIPIETDKLPDGPSELRIDATNTAHNQNYSTPFTIDAENYPSNPSTDGGSNVTTQTKQETPQNTTSTIMANQPSDNGFMTGTQNTTGVNGNKGPATGTALPSFPTRIRTRLLHHRLVIEGFTSRHAAGWIWLEIKAISSNGSYWTSKRMRRQIHHGDFRAIANLPPYLRPTTLTLTIKYPGNRSFRRTTRHIGIH